MNKCPKCIIVLGCRKCNDYNECPICLDFISMKILLVIIY